MGDRVAVTMEMAELGGGDTGGRRWLLREVASRPAHRTAATNNMWGSLARLLRHVGEHRKLSGAGGGACPYSVS